MKFTIRCTGTIVGTYSGADEAEALTNLAADAGYPSWSAMLAANGLTRDDYKVEKVEG